MNIGLLSFEIYKQYPFISFASLYTYYYLLYHFLFVLMLHNIVTPSKWNVSNDWRLIVWWINELIKRKF